MHCTCSCIEWSGHGLEEEKRKLVHMHIAGIVEVNTIRSYLQLNFHVRTTCVYRDYTVHDNLLVLLVVSSVRDN